MLGYRGFNWPSSLAVPAGHCEQDPEDVLLAVPAGHRAPFHVSSALRVGALMRPYSVLQGTWKFEELGHQALVYVQVSRLHMP